MEVGGGAAAGTPTPEALAHLRSVIAKSGAPTYNGSGTAPMAIRTVTRKAAAPSIFNETAKWEVPFSLNKTTTKHDKESVPATDQNTKTYGPIARKIRSWFNGRDAISITFGGFQWDRFAEALLFGDFSSLSEDQYMVAHSIADELENAAQDNSAYLNQSKLVLFALGIIARIVSSNESKRFSMHALKSAPDWVLEHRNPKN